jgi:hypothetical protein
MLDDIFVELVDKGARNLLVQNWLGVYSCA